ncbi:MAG: hypothetical protein Q8Q37_01780 [bacterium]|nr:hypothetical protein [bacterium]
MVILVVGFGGGVWFYERRQKKLTLRISFAGSEVEKMFKLLRSDVDDIRQALSTPTVGDDEYAIKHLEENLKKMEEYIKRGIEKIKK